MTNMGNMRFAMPLSIGTQLTNKCDEIDWEAAALSNMPWIEWIGRLWIRFKGPMTSTYERFLGDSLATHGRG